MEILPESTSNSSARTTSGLFLSQSKFAKEILEKAHMQHCNPCKTPVDNESKLGPDGDPVFDSTMYRSLVAQSPDDPLLGILGDNLLSWSAKRHIRNLLLELHAPLRTATLVYCDDVSVVYLSTKPNFLADFSPYSLIMAGDSTVDSHLPLANVLHTITIKLSSTNYLIWKNQMMPLLAYQKLTCYVDGFIPMPSSTIAS
ncbi:ribonuclease H-like domain-containing protein, partial [Tanacetum coccineum]